MKGKDSIAARKEKVIAGNATWKTISKREESGNASARSSGEPTEETSVNVERKRGQKARETAEETERSVVRHFGQTRQETSSQPHTA